MEVCSEKRSAVVLEVKVVHHGESYGQPISDRSSSAHFVHDDLTEDSLVELCCSRRQKVLLTHEASGGSFLENICCFLHLYHESTPVTKQVVLRANS